MDQEQIAYFDERFHETSRQISSLREDVQLLAEAILQVGLKLDFYHHEFRLSSDDVQRWMEKPLRELDNRVRYLEGPKERRYQDVVDHIRRFLGKPSLQPPVSSD